MRMFPFAFWKIGIPPVVLTAQDYTQVRTQGFSAPLRLTGINFDKGNPIAYVDGVATTGNVVDATHMDVDMPAHASGTGITVMVDNGGGLSNPLTVEYWSPLNLGVGVTDLQGWWPGLSDTGYTSVSTNITLGAGTFLDQSGNSRNLVQASSSPPEGGPYYQNIVPQGTPSTVGETRLTASIASSNFVGAANFTMWGCITFNNSPNFPDSGGTWLGCNIMNCSLAQGCGIGIQGIAGNQTHGRARIVVYDGGIQMTELTTILDLATPYLVVGTKSGNTINVYVNNVQGTQLTGVGNVANLTSSLNILNNPSNNAAIDGPGYDFGAVKRAIDATERGKLLLYCRQAYGLALPAV